MTQKYINGLVALGVVVVLVFGGYALFHGGQRLGGSTYEAIPKQFGGGFEGRFFPSR